MRLHSVALTNKPAIPNMEALVASDRITRELSMNDYDKSSVATAEQKMGELKAELAKTGFVMDDSASFVQIINLAMRVIKSVGKLSEDQISKLEASERIAVLALAEVEAVDPAEIRKRLDTIRGLLKVDGNTTSLDLLDKVIERLSADGAKDGDGDKGTVAASVRKSLGLSDNASNAEVVVAVNSLVMMRDNAESVSQAHADLAQRELNAFLQPYIDRGVIDPKCDHEGDYAFILQLAETDREQAKRWLEFRAKWFLPPQGRTKPPTGRQTMIFSAARQFNGDGNLKRQTDVRSYVDLTLRDKGLPKLSDDEFRTLVA